MKPTTRKAFAVLLFLAIFAGSGAAWAQNRYDDSEMEDRFYITLGGFAQTDIRTTLRLDAKSSDDRIAAGALIGLESLFDVDDKVTTVRLDGWYRFTKRHRISWTYWGSKREGLSTYNGDPIDIGNVTINDNDSIATEDKSRLMAVNWSYSFVNTSKYEAWLGTGLNFQTIDYQIDVNVGGSQTTNQESAAGTVPIPTINFGGRYNFGKRWRLLVMQQLFGLKIGDFSGKLNNTRFLAEVNITPKFGLGGGFERFNFEINAESDDFLGELDKSYTALTLYLKGQF